MTGCSLIVHADDFGLSAPVNEGIIEAHVQGIVTSTSIMACATHFDHAVALARSNSTLDLGIHLTLTGEIPVADSRHVASLLTPRGRFHTHARDFLKLHLAGRIDMGELEHELDAQIRKVLDSGLQVSHIDAHQHIHMLPGIRRRVGALAKRYDIQAIRYPVERPALYMLDGSKSLGRLAELAALTAFSALSRTSDTIAPDRFFGFHFGGRLDRKNLLQIIGQLPSRGICELMCHPGKRDPGSAYREWGYDWQGELDALTCEATKLSLATRGVTLASYAGLVNGAAKNSKT